MRVTWNWPKNVRSVQEAVTETVVDDGRRKKEEVLGHRERIGGREFRNLTESRPRGETAEARARRLSRDGWVASAWVYVTPLVATRSWIWIVTCVVSVGFSIFRLSCACALLRFGPSFGPYLAVGKMATLSLRIKICDLRAQRRERELYSNS